MHKELLCIRIVATGASSYRRRLKIRLITKSGIQLKSIAAVLSGRPEKPSNVAGVSGISRIP
jgi:hypothetical protein